MRHIVVYKRQRFLERSTFDHFLQLWFNYHFLFFNYLMVRGLKLRAFNTFLKIKEGLKHAEDFDPSFIFLIAMLNITPSLMIREFVKGNNVFQVPFPVTYWKKIILSCSWVIKLLKNSSKGIDVAKVVDVLINSLLNEGLAIDQKIQVYFLAESNRHLLKNKIFRR